MPYADASQSFYDAFCGSFFYHGPVVSGREYWDTYCMGGEL